MKKLLITIALLLISMARVFAHETETGITNLAEAEWVGPLVAALVITAAITLAKIIRWGSNRQKQKL